MSYGNFGFGETTPTSAGLDDTMSYVEAISDGLRVSMIRDSDVFIMGEDVGGTFGGAFNVTKGFAEEFGDERVMNMPMTELGFIGAATGMALMGLRPVIEMQFADFISTGFDSIVQFAATTHYRWRGAVPWVIRAPSDGGIRSGPFHSQNPEAWFIHTPGLKVVAPATPADAKGLLNAAIQDNNPVIYFESKALYRSLSGHVPTGNHIVEIGKAAVRNPGSEVTVVTYGAMVHAALEAANQSERSVEVIDLRSLKPWDSEAVLDSVEKTGRCVVVHPANRLGGFGAEIAATVSEQSFEHLDAPVLRLGGLDVPVPFSPPLEDAYRPSADTILDAIESVCSF
jgi:2-oxoisovalerate dehydrogenase E1 component beta subunit